MAVQPGSQIQRAKAWLLKSGLSQRDQDLYQIINALIDAMLQAGIATEEAIANSGGGGSVNAIDALIDDVVATGPGTVSAIIQPNVVTYNKIQQVTALRLVGNPEGSLQDMVEIPLGDNLAFVDGVLQVQVEPGTDGLLHRLLSLTHFDTVAASPVLGDLIYATEGPDFEGEYYGCYILALVTEDFAGVREGYTSGFHGVYTPSNSMGYAPPELAYISTPHPQNLLAREYIDGFILALAIEDFTGLRAGYAVPTYVGGNNAAYYAFTDLSIIAPPSPANEDISALWTRRPIGSEDDVLTVIDGIPQWQALPSIPPEADYPWQDITFDAADFTATGGTTPGWAVALADVERWQYQQFPGAGGVGTNVRIAIYLRGTSVTGSGPTQLQIALPFNIVGRFALYISIQENGAAVNNVYVEYDEAVSTNSLALNKIGGGAFDTTAAGTFLAFEISATKAP